MYNECLGLISSTNLWCITNCYKTFIFMYLFYWVLVTWKSKLFLTEYYSGCWQFLIIILLSICSQLLFYQDNKYNIITPILCNCMYFRNSCCESLTFQFQIYKVWTCTPRTFYFFTNYNQWQFNWKWPNLPCASMK